MNDMLRWSDRNVKKKKCVVVLFDVFGLMQMIVIAVEHVVIEINQNISYIISLGCMLSFSKSNSRIETRRTTEAILNEIRKQKNSLCLIDFYPFIII